MRLIGVLLLTTLVYYIAWGQDSTLERPLADFTIPFHAKAVFLDKGGKSILDSAVKFARENATAYVQIESFSYGLSERDYQLSWDKAYSAVKYLRSRGVDSACISFMYGLEGDPQVVRVLFWKTDRYLWDVLLPPAPIPCYSYHKLTPKRCKEAH